MNNSILGCDLRSSSDLNVTCFNTGVFKKGGAVGGVAGKLCRCSLMEDDVINPSLKVLAESKKQEDSRPGLQEEPSGKSLARKEVSLPFFVTPASLIADTPS